MRRYQARVRLTDQHAVWIAVAQFPVERLEGVKHKVVRLLGKGWHTGKACNAEFVGDFPQRAVIQRHEAQAAERTHIAHAVAASVWHISGGASTLHFSTQPAVDAALRDRERIELDHQVVPVNGVLAGLEQYIVAPLEIQRLPVMRRAAAHRRDGKQRGMVVWIAEIELAHCHRGSPLGMWLILPTRQRCSIPAKSGDPPENSRFHVGIFSF
ncbi:hypothetical protein [Cupriavidus necator]|uniref:hypothetical protein n=1 Tax=Cupriavidus necator TaxID=106590 RepID=UPI003C6C0203